VDARPDFGTWAAVRVAVPGRPFGIGGGRRMRLTAENRCVDWNGGTGWDCRDETNTDGNQAPGTVNVQGYGYTGGTRYLLLYRGPAVPARMGVTAGSRVVPALVVTQAGHPGWTAGYLDLPASAAPQDPFGCLGLTVWDAQGRVLATLG
jgi:hypothetical protein